MEPVRERVQDRRLLGEMLIEAGLLRRAGLAAGLEEQRLRGGRLGYNLLKLGVVAPAPLYLFLKDSGGVLEPELMDTLRTSPAVDLIPARLAHYYGMVPVRAEAGVLVLALADADAPRLIPAVEQLTGLRVDPVVCPPGLIAEALARFYPAEVEPGVIYRPAGDNAFVVSDRRRGLRPLLPEVLRGDAAAQDWLRALLAEGIRRGARGLRFEPSPDILRVVFRGSRGEESSLQAPVATAPGIGCLIEGLARLGTRRRVVPREGRFVLRLDARRIAASVRALPGLAGATCVLDLRAPRIRPLAPEEIETQAPGFGRTLDRLAAFRRGLLLIAGTGGGEIAAGLDLVLGALGERLPVRAAVGPWEAPSSVTVFAGETDEEQVPFAPLLHGAVQASPDILFLPDLARPERAAAALAEARDRVVIAGLRAADACEAAAWVGHAGPGWRLAPGDPAAPAGILALRLMERLCAACRRPCDALDALPPRARRLAAGGTLLAAQGCVLCRGSGFLDLEPVVEFLETPAGDPPGWPGIAAGELRRRRAATDRDTLFLSALRRALAGALDVREPLRLLLHEQP